MDEFTARTPSDPVGKAAPDQGLYRRIPAWERYEEDEAEDRRPGVPPAPVPSYRGLLEDPPEDSERIGICCSGGGIRSAAFNLGALQELQHAGILRDATYLSAVSGGSYIAAALTMVAKSAPGGVGGNSDSGLVTDEAPPFYRNSPEEQYLRNRSSYMAPGGGGRISLVFHVALGLLVNLAFIGATLVMLAWLVAWYYHAAQPGLQAGLADEAFVDFGLVAVWIPIAIAGVGALGLGLVYMFGRPLLERWAIVACAIVGLLLLIQVGIPSLLLALRQSGIGETHTDVANANAGAGISAGGGFVALLVTVLTQLRSALSVEKAKEASKRFMGLSARMKRITGQLVAWVLGPAVVAAVLVFFLLLFVTAGHMTLWVPIIGIPLLAGFFVYADVTAWSLHPFYRRRLCSAFALKRVDREGDDEGKALERDYKDLGPLSKTRYDSSWGVSAWPTLLVCAAANVSDGGATPPGRSVTSFTFSPYAMGGPLVGGVPTDKFEERIVIDRRMHDLTLAAAVATSGAAISPSMGKETRGAFRFLLGLANVRLGVWVPNPRRINKWMKEVDQAPPDQSLTPLSRDPRAVEDSRPQVPRGKLRSPRPGAKYLIKELFGWTSVNDAYLYVTDGGHYENLGLVELLRRGCTQIYCFDASGGKKLSALGDAIALARSELDVEIENLDPSDLEEDDETRFATACCASGAIRYPDGRVGTLVYARTVVTSDMPYDVKAFLEKDPAFPHHSTADQLYTDQKFEAYRELGAYAGRQALLGVSDETLVRRWTASQ